MSRCDFYFKSFYYDKRIKLINETMELTQKILKENGPIIGPVVAAFQNKLAFDKDLEFQRQIKKGPICGACVIENGYKTDLIL